MPQTGAAEEPRRRSGYTTSSADCAGAGTIAATILFGPINYFGANPKLTCH